MDDDAAERAARIAALAEEAVAACTQAWPGVAITTARAAAHFGRIHLEGVRHLGDLCLTWACLDGDVAAQRAIDGVIRAEAERAVRDLRQPAWLADEVHQEVSRRLLVADGSAAPRLATYGGQAVLGRWLGVTATRTALNLMRAARPHAALDDDAAAALPDLDTPPDVAALKDRFRDEVRAAVKASFAALDNPRDRNLLRLYYFEQIALDRLGQMFRVHASTVSRWLASLREQIFEATRERLAERLGLGDAELASLVRAVRSDLDLTLSQILKAPP
jgi:RNA polymerase sigma-70 factor (ECF subfamily)